MCYCWYAPPTGRQLIEYLIQQPSWYLAQYLVAIIPVVLSYPIKAFPIGQRQTSPEVVIHESEVSGKSSFENAG